MSLNENQNEVKKIEFELLGHQEKFIDSKKRFAVNSGGVGSGKTYSLVIKSILLIIENPGIYGLIGGQTMPLVRNTIMRDFFYLCPEEIIQDHNKTLNYVRFVNDSELIFLPFDEHTKLKSLNLGFICIEEMTGIKEEIFKILRTRLRQKNMPCQLFGGTNPAGFQHWIYKYFIDSPIPDSEIIYSKSFDNKFLPKEYLNDLESLKKANPEYYNRMVLGKWGQLEGLIYNITQENILKESELPQEYKRIILGLDFGFEHPTGILVIGQLENKYFVIEEVYKKGLTSGDIENEIKKVFDKYYGIDYIYCDSARPEIIEDLRRSGYPAVKSRKDVFLGIMAIKTLLGQKELYICDNCTNLLRESENYIWDKDTPREQPIKFMDDLLDALRYAIFTDIKKRPDNTKTKKLSWA